MAMRSNNASDPSAMPNVTVRDSDLRFARGLPSRLAGSLSQPVLGERCRSVHFDGGGSFAPGDGRYDAYEFEQFSIVSRDGRKERICFVSNDRFVTIAGVVIGRARSDAHRVFFLEKPTYMCELVQLMAGDGVKFVGSLPLVLLSQGRVRLISMVQDSQIK